MRCRIRLLSLMVGMAMLAGVIPALSQSPGGGPLPFDPQKVTTVQGVVVALPEIKATAVPEMVQLTLKTSRGENLLVVLGPNWFVARQAWKPALLDRVEVKGSPVILEGHRALVAQELRRGEQVLQFRDEKGMPLWAGPRGKER